MGKLRIDGYILYHELGSGACGTVYRASKPDRLTPLASAPEEYAVKVYRSERGKEQFRQELEILQVVRSHPNVSQLVESCEGALKALVMPLYRGVDLTSFVRQGKSLPEATAARITRDILVAVQHVHQCGVLHRDINPDNVRISDDRAVLIDFDVACYLTQGDDPDLVRAGSAGYLSPEMVLRQPIGTPSDLFSVGCTLFFMYKHKPPFRTTPHSDNVVFRKTARCKLHFDECFDDVSEMCKSLISSLIVRSPARRLSSEQALRHEWIASKVGHLLPSSVGSKRNEQGSLPKLGVATVAPAGSFRQTASSATELCVQDLQPTSTDGDAQHSITLQSHASAKQEPQRPSGDPAGPARKAYRRCTWDRLTQQQSFRSAGSHDDLSELEPLRPAGNPLGAARSLYRKYTNASDALSDGPASDPNAQSSATDA
eukprot:TRINITY_DN12803_c0_g2_i1.p1 TRINITY_DN12803_c0_g2~~TRINITY_DN12803_c0_g2_i1.p1  ORF type:complete len:447 (-),score=38.34 TRINITY_DN12803_c0_g2_i1:556-1842(-)